MIVYSFPNIKKPLLNESNFYFRSNVQPVLDMSPLVPKQRLSSASPFSQGFKSLVRKLFEFSPVNKSKKSDFNQRCHPNVFFLGFIGLRNVVSISNLIWDPLKMVRMIIVRIKDWLWIYPHVKCNFARKIGIELSAFH